MKRALIAVILAAPVCLSLGCGKEKTQVPTKLDQPLPPPPVGSTGGKGGKTDMGDGKSGGTSVAK